MRTPLANVDATWHRMDEPANHMVVTGVLIFDEPVSRKHLRALLERRLLRFMRFLRVLPLRAESRHRSHRARTPRTTGQPMGLGVTGPCS
jgi:hypothetical protein